MIKADIPALETSTDCRRAVAIVACVWSFVWLVCFDQFVLTLNHRKLINNIPAEVANWVATATFLAVFLGVFFFYLLDIHETVYDHYFVKWRVRHEADFILPRLFGPFRERFVSDYVDVLRENAPTLTTRVFCPFVTGKDHRLDPKFMRKFYKALTVYWVTELTEMAMIAWLVCTFLYAGWGRISGTVPVEWQAVLLFQVCGAIALGAVNNLLFVRAARTAVRQRTQEEIDEIVRYYYSDLEQHVLEAARHLQILRPQRPITGSGVPFSRLGPVSDTADASRAFLASPMASLAPAEYIDDRALMCQVSSALQAHCGFEYVFYAGEQIPEQSGFDDVYLALDQDLREIRKCGTFIFHYPSRVPSSALFELGYALALGKRVVLLVKNHNHLPFLLQAAAQLDSVSECTYKDDGDLLAIITACPLSLFPKVASSDSSG